MTSDALGPVRRPYSAAARPGSAPARLKTSDDAVDPAAEGSALSREGARDQNRDGHPPHDREGASSPAPETPAEPHPLVYMAVDTVTGEVLWQVQGAPVPADPSAKPGAYGPQGQLVYSKDTDDAPHGLSRLV